MIVVHMIEDVCQSFPCDFCFFGKCIAVSVVLCIGRVREAHTSLRDINVTYLEPEEDTVSLDVSNRLENGRTISGCDASCIE